MLRTHNKEKGEEHERIVYRKWGDWSVATWYGEKKNAVTDIETNTWRLKISMQIVIVTLWNFFLNFLFDVNLFNYKGMPMQHQGFFTTPIEPRTASTNVNNFSSFANQGKR